MNKYENISFLWEEFISAKGWNTNPCHPLYPGKDVCKDKELINHIPGAPNFKYVHFRCKDKKKTLVPKALFPNVQKLAKNLQALRDYVKAPVHVISGYRTKEYNSSKDVGGAKNSQHLKAKAADIKVDGKTAVEVYQIILTLIGNGKMEQGGLGLYNTFVHYDVRGRKGRWDFSTGKKAKTIKPIGDNEGNEGDSSKVLNTSPKSKSRGSKIRVKKKRKN